MQDARHINMTDPATEQVYCHFQGDVAKFDGVHVATVCWGCPFWAGLAGGFGVECVYDDANATQPEVTYTKPATAMAEAPEAVEDADSIASTDGIAARDERVKLTPATEDAEAPTEEVPAEEAPAAAPAKKNPVPPQFQKKKKAPAALPPMPAKSMTAVDLISETIATMVEAQRTVSKSMQDDIVLPRAEAVRIFTDMPELKSWPADVVSLNAIVKARAKKNMEATDATFAGLFARCMSTEGAMKSGNPQAYSAAICQRVTGEWPGDSNKKK